MSYNRTPDEPIAEGSDEQTGGADNESRRKVLARFGRYAAAAPTALLLLQPRGGQAHDVSVPHTHHIEYH